MTIMDFHFDDVTLNCVVDGPDDGPLALCLHGFPDTRNTYRHLTPALVELGYRTVSVSLRGYAPSSVAADGNYQLAASAFDVLRLYEELGGDDRAVLIGHDWGAAIVYLALNAAPDRWRKAVTMAVPPLAVFASAFMGFDQLRASWYMFFFQNPLADMVVPLNDSEFIAKLCATWSPNYDWTDEMPEVRAALHSSEALGAALGYYRSMFDGVAKNPEHQFITDAANTTANVPVLYLHGTDDGCILAKSVSDVTAFLGAGSRSEFIAGAGHFLHLEAPDRVNAMIVEWLES